MVSLLQLRRHGFLSVCFIYFRVFQCSIIVYPFESWVSVDVVDVFLSMSLRFSIVLEVVDVCLVFGLASQYFAVDVVVVVSRR